MSTTRRTLMMGLAALPVAPALPAMADPIFVLIERHRAARLACNNCPRGISDDDLDALMDREGDAMAGLLAARPGTWPAFAALAAYLNDHITRSGDWHSASACLAALAEGSRRLVEGGAA
jgi:hypothetical protein